MVNSAWPLTCPGTLTRLQTLAGLSVLPGSWAKTLQIFWQRYSIPGTLAASKALLTACKRAQRKLSVQNRHSWGVAGQAVCQSLGMRQCFGKLTCNQQLAATCPKVIELQGHRHIFMPPWLFLSASQRQLPSLLMVWSQPLFSPSFIPAPHGRCQAVPVRAGCAVSCLAGECPKPCKLLFEKSFFLKPIVQGCKAANPTEISFNGLMILYSTDYKEWL